jgi:general stress protein 26
MPSLSKFESNPQAQLLSEIKKARCIMLGSPNKDEHMQPMTPQVDDEEQIIYFYSDRYSDLGKAVIQAPSFVHLCHIDDDYQACLKGYLETHHESSTVEKFWNPIVGAWYPGGQSDPKLLMLKFTPEHAAVWASDKSTIGFAYEIAKANFTKTMPDVGRSAEIRL